MQQQLAALENHLIELRSRYTDNYPDVVKAKEDIARLKKRIAQQEAAENSEKTQEVATSKPLNILAEPVEIRQLRAQLHSLEETIQTNQREQARIRQEIAAYEAKLKMTPAVEQQYKDITRNYQTALEFYNSLLAKEDQSQMSTSLEKRQEGEQFSVLDPANLPHEPSFPNYLRFAGGGLVVGLLLGFGAVLLLEMRDKALRDERDIEYFLGVPTLGVVPALDSVKRDRHLLDWKARVKGVGMKRLAG